MKLQRFPLPAAISTLNRLNESAGIAQSVTRPQGGCSGFQIPAGPQDFFLLQNVHYSMVTEIPSWGGIKRPRLVFVQPPPSSAEFENELSHTAAAPVCLHGVGTDNFTFLAIR